jgi:hypothetical protein
MTIRGMRCSARRLLLAVATAFTTASAFMPAADARLLEPAAPAAAAHGRAVRAVAVRPNDILYSQNNKDSGDAVNSQDFESEYDAFDDAAAADFRVPKGLSWHITQVDVTGRYWTLGGPCRDETVIFSKNAGGVPGRVIASQTVVGVDLSGSFQIPVDVTIEAKSRPRRAWVSVVCNMDFSVGGEWYWEIRTVQGGKYPGQWENPGGGFGVGCTTWEPVQSCTGLGPDFMFALEGTQG